MKKTFFTCNYFQNIIAFLLENFFMAREYLHTMGKFYVTLQFTNQEKALITKVAFV